MLRILLWKIGFEWAQIKRLVYPATDKRIFYFAFGANLCVDVLEKRGIEVYDEFDYELENATLKFSQRGFYRNHGYASADEFKGDRVYGKMYLILQSDALRMDYFEGVPFLDVHHKVFHTANGLKYYYYRARSPQEGLKPTQEYLDYLVTAYRDMPIVSNQYIETLASTEVLEECLPQNQTGDFIRNINQWPRFIHPLLICYERCCLMLVKFLWNRSAFQWLVQKQNDKSTCSQTNQ
ncbi:MAG: hypothetical protein GKR95_15700 [Gammaproteobacteria bacterium]|nr:hypothetical protein [Gammaproteobacteria bacterium]